MLLMDDCFSCAFEYNESAHSWLVFALALFESSLGHVVQMRRLRGVKSSLIWQEDSGGLVIVCGCFWVETSKILCRAADIRRLPIECNILF